MLFNLRHNIKEYFSNLYLSEFDKVLKHKFKFHHVSLDSIKDAKCSLNDFYTAKEDGIIIENFLSQAEVNEVLDNLKDQKSYIHKIRFGHTFGITLSDSKEEKYFKYTSLFIPELLKVADSSIFDRLEYCFSTLSGTEAQMAKNDHGESFVPATIRSLYPNKGGLPIHCERATTTDIDPISNEVSDIFNDENILSYFIVLQNADKGGSLILFNSKEYEPGMGLKSLSDVFMLKGQRFKPNPGDLLIFNGGSIWHKVENLKGDKNRITLAGFLNLNKEKDKWIYWS